MIVSFIPDNRPTWRVRFTKSGQPDWLLPLLGWVITSSGPTDAEPVIEPVVIHDGTAEICSDIGFDHEYDDWKIVNASGEIVGAKATAGANQ